VGTGEDAVPPGALESPLHHMLQEATDESLRRQAYKALLAKLDVFGSTKSGWCQNFRLLFACSILNILLPLVVQN
jgi:hypothetical protein